ncbi:hypothetical protein EV644_106342 [Kribbella orskensis]|uniref:Uncharacterized protein n=1 Tax=Kribbella orskensis TaxID=2512216 RepID=A0ABY2BL20_9ACTN|nr:MULTISPECIES: hypothetical protein [Kribbella]TCN40414.1 hypothetical protein EV642_105342 [Kribbella sp. VKM Ac-2500]TCO23034.1 hypothetical protein EV644_106342 [Kribbella orskensis]
MIPLGFEMHLSPVEHALVLVVLGLLAAAAAMPASLTLATVGAVRSQRSGRPGLGNGIWYWFWGTALTWGAMVVGFNLDLGWYSIPVGWLPGLAAAGLLWPRRRGPLGELRWGSTRRPVGER